MKLDKLNLNGKKDSIEVLDNIFSSKLNKKLVSSVLYKTNANYKGRHAKTKQQNEVAGPTSKIYAQKGTGNARQGSSKPPHYRGGATSMGPQNRDHSFSLNKKEKTLALKCALSNKSKNEEIIFVDSLEIADHKTKKLFNSLKKFNFNSALFIHSEKNNNENFKKASSNIPKLAMLSEKGLNVRDLMTFDKIFIETTAIEQITKRLI